MRKGAGRQRRDREYIYVNAQVPSMCVLVGMLGKIYALAIREWSTHSGAVVCVGRCRVRRAPAGRVGELLAWHPACRQALHRLCRPAGPRRGDSGAQRYQQGSSSGEGAGGQGTAVPAVPAAICCTVAVIYRWQCGLLRRSCRPDRVVAGCPSLCRTLEAAQPPELLLRLPQRRAWAVRRAEPGSGPRMHGGENASVI